MQPKSHFRHLVLATLVAIGTVAADDSATMLERQREAFRDAFPAAERGDWEQAARQEALLARYPLWPDLQAAYLRTRIDRPNYEAAIRSFIDKYQPLKPARALRYRLALNLARSGRHVEYLEIYDAHYSRLGQADLDCLALNAQIALDQQEGLVERARRLWLVGRSQADECDPAFAQLRSEDVLDTALYRERYEIAVAAGQFRLARYLARSIDEATLADANRWVAARERPEQFLADADNYRAEDSYRQQLAYAVKRIAYRDPPKAAEAWDGVTARLRMPDDTRNDVERHIALWAARLNDPRARRLLNALPAGAVDDEVRRWRIRTALRDGDWSAVVSGIDALPVDPRQQQQWRYWRAVARGELGATAEATLDLATLARERSYYGFLAADRLELPYAYAHDSIEPDAEILASLSKNPALVRARELFLVGLDGRGRSEWNSAVAKLNEQEARQAALLAHRWGWHSRAISTAAKTGHFDDLELRYPLPYRESFKSFAADWGIDESWAYGIARSESLFMRDIRSHAGALGLMQVLPETGRRIAREIREPYNGWDTLVDPDTNIRLGTFFLSKVYRRFDQNMALATAAYNAGPLRVEQWLPPDGAVDARIWIENIPFNETRDYVRRVLTSDAIFSWRMNGTMPRISERLAAVTAPSDPDQDPGG
jgi:soluble lytic murein transglycosylase